MSLHGKDPFALHAFLAGVLWVLSKPGVVCVQCIVSLYIVVSLMLLDGHTSRIRFAAPHQQHAQRGYGCVAGA